MASAPALAPELKVGEYVKHPDHKREVHITQIDGDMIAFSVTAPVGSGQHRTWAHVRTFIQGEIL